MSDWIKTSDGWKQTSGNGVSASEVTEIKDALTQYEKDGYLGKNLFNATVETVSHNGVTCVRQSDGTYVLNGTASSTAYLIIGYPSQSLVGKTLKLVGCPSNESTTQYWMQIRALAENDNGSGKVFTPTSIDKSENPIRILVNSGYTCNNLVFKPMITTDLNATYNDYVQYAPSNIELGKELTDTKESLSQYEQSGYLGKNLFPNEMVNAGDEYITSGEYDLPKGDYILTFDNKTSNTIVYWFASASKVSDKSNQIVSANSKATFRFTVTEDGNAKFSMRFEPRSSFSVSSVANVMVRSANIADDTYAPYCPSNNELKQSLTTLENEITPTTATDLTFVANTGYDISATYTITKIGIKTYVVSFNRFSLTKSVNEIKFGSFGKTVKGIVAGVVINRTNTSQIGTFMVNEFGDVYINSTQNTIEQAVLSFTLVLA